MTDLTEVSRCAQKLNSIIHHDYDSAKTAALPYQHNQHLRLWVANSVYPLRVFCGSSG